MNALHTTRAFCKPREAAMSKPFDPLLTPSETAARLGIAPSTLNIWRCTGRYNLPFVKAGARVRYRTSDVEAFIARRTRNTHVGPEDAA